MQEHSFPTLLLFPLHGLSDSLENELLIIPFAKGISNDFPIE